MSLHLLFLPVRQHAHLGPLPFLMAVRKRSSAKSAPLITSLLLMTVLGVVACCSRFKADVIREEALPVPDAWSERLVTGLYERYRGMLFPTL